MPSFFKYIIMYSIKMQITLLSFRFYRGYFETNL